MKTGSIFIEFFGDSPNTRLLDFLITGRTFDYSLTDLAKNAGIGWVTLHRILPRLEQQKILVKTREIGRAKLYKLNQENQEVAKLIGLYDSLLEKQIKQAREKEMQIIKVKG